MHKSRATMEEYFIIAALRQNEFEKAVDENDLR